jgi:hypothetical protein
MHIDTHKKKLFIVVASISLVLISGALTVYALKQHTKGEQAAEQKQAVDEQANKIAAAPDIEKKADKLFTSGNLAAAKIAYQQAATLYAEDKNTQAEERVNLQLSLIDSMQKATPAKQIELSDVPVDSKLNAQLGTPPPVSKQ